MAEQTNISWCDHTFNAWIGCTKVSEGCAHCYAETQDRNRFSRTLGGGTPENPISHWGKGAPRYRTADTNWHDPVKWNRQAADLPRRPRVFCASLADWLDDEVPAEWLADLLALIYDTPDLDWLLLTKRPENWMDRLFQARATLPIGHPVALMIGFWLTKEPHLQTAPSNVWIGTTVENQARANERIPKLLEIPAKVRFLSCEPLLGPINLRQCPGPGSATVCANAFDGNALFIGDIGGADFAWTPRNMINWLIAGGESGPGHRKMGVEWLADLAEECTAAGVPFFCKQDSGARSGMQGRLPDELWNRKEFPKV